MSHLPERKQKDCLNCGTTVLGKYCQVCGQENVEPKETAWQLSSHLFNDLTHFDGKVFSSMRDLVLKPGFLSKEYMQGRRVRYLHPIRMYLFTSFIFFLVFFSLYKVDENSFRNLPVTKGAVDNIDSAELKKISPEINNGKPLTKEELQKKLSGGGISISSSNYKSKKEYDSLLKAGVVKDNWFERTMTYKAIALDEKYHNNSRLEVADLVSHLMHSIPQMLFVLLPLFALFLKLLYVRHKDFYYTGHAIFAIHFYVFIFLGMLLIFGIAKIEAVSGAQWLQYINYVLVITLFYYLYKAMRNFYGQRRAKTILKYLLLLFSFICFGAFLLIIFFFISIFQI
jgi:Protein of unknown function (DUF3667)